MTQKGTVFHNGTSWFFKYRTNFLVDGQVIRKQKVIKLAPVSERYAKERDLADLVDEILANVKECDKHERSGENFIQYVRDTYLPWVKQTKKESTYAAYSSYFKLYIQPHVRSLYLRDFDRARVAKILDSAARLGKLSKDTAGKIRSLLAAIFTFAGSRGDFASLYGNPAHEALLPACAKKPKPTKVAKHEEVKAILEALEGLPLERAAVAIIAMTGMRPCEARGLRWSDYDRGNEQIHVRRNVWHSQATSTKTPQSIRVCAVVPELAEILDELWRHQERPLDGVILAGPEMAKPVILDNMAKRSIRERLKERGVPWPQWYALRRYFGTRVREESNLETTSKALGNSPGIADKHYIKPSSVLPDVRKATRKALAHLVN